jgi:hypothetical protein
MLQTVLIALGLSMDAFAVSITSGMCSKELRPIHIVRGAFSFGFLPIPDARPRLVARHRVSRLYPGF